MSLKALVEILVHLDSLRNIDLFFQGVYYIRVRAYHGTKQTLLQPYWNFETIR